jgi:hypothetical protein
MNRLITGLVTVALVGILPSSARAGQPDEPFAAGGIDAVRLPDPPPRGRASG